MSKAEQAQWREAMKPVWKKFEKDIGSDILQSRPGRQQELKSAPVGRSPSRPVPARRCGRCHRRSTP